MNEKQATASAGSATVAAQASPNTALKKDVPEEIKDLPFENAGSCSLDVINNTLLTSTDVAVKRAEGLSVDGWAYDEKSSELPAVFLQLVNGDERYYAKLHRHGGRDDLVKAFGKSELANAGYAAAVDIASLPAGQYEIKVVQKVAGKNLVCSTNRKLNLNG